MAFPEKFIDELVDRNDIVDVVSGYVRLSRRSGANQFGLCPFHSEKTPSFAVNQEKQIYHCFGCGKGGSVINFIMEIENLGYRDAVAFLARRAGMAMPQEQEDAESRKRARMLALNKDAARFFYEQLSTPGGSRARDYMARRRISPATAKNFGLGFAPDSWDSLEKAMRQKGYSDFELAEAGLVRRGKNGGFYDTFRDRLMFPVIDVRGSVIGFSGRILGDGEPKYMNSPETLVFNKSRNLFALNLAKKSKSGYILLSEGNIDVVSLHQAGFDSAVASLGTSLTPEQARLLSRYTDQVIIAYDNDGAGIKASQRAIGILEKLDVKVKVLRLEGAKDPDEFIKAKGPEAFRKLLEGSESQADYRLRIVAEKYDLTKPEQKVAFLNEAYNIVARMYDSARRDIYSSRLASMVNVRADAVKSDVENRRSQLLGQAKKAEQRENMQVEKQNQPMERTLRYDDPDSARAEEGLIWLLSLDPELGLSPDLPEKEVFSSAALGNIYDVLRQRIAQHESVSFASLSSVLSSDEMALLTRIQQRPETLSQGNRALHDYIRVIRERKEIRDEKNAPLDLRAIAVKKLETEKRYTENG